ncbi:MAG: chemotaxis protein [Desulfovibrio sp.]|nr:chemotaxis protein [Desulfovibrio sp.]
MLNTTRRSFFLFCFCFFLVLTFLHGCGPKDIGNETVVEENTPTSVSAAEQMRYPMFGTDANQRMLFLNNKMDTMVLKQAIIRNAKTPGTTSPVSVSPEDPAYRAVPKQQSPFRQ